MEHDLQVPERGVDRVRAGLLVCKATVSTVMLSRPNGMCCKALSVPVTESPPLNLFHPFSVMRSPRNVRNSSSSDEPSTLLYH